MSQFDCNEQYNTPKVKTDIGKPKNSNSLVSFILRIEEEKGTNVQ